MPRISTDNYDTVASWNGSQDLIIVEQPDGTKVATPAMVKQYVLNDMDEVPTQNSNDTVKSGGVFSAVDDVYSVMGQNGAKNLIPYPYNHTTKTQNGVTFTDNGDGTITIVTSENGATANTTFEFQTRASEKLFLKGGKYTATGCPLIAGGGIVFKITNTNVSPSLTFNDTGSGVTFTLENDLPFGAIFTVSKDVVITTPIVVKPMLRLAEDTDNTYQPYAKTNKELTEVIGDLSQTGLTGDSVAEQLGTVKGQIETANGQITSINNSLSPIDAIVKRFYINNGNTSLDTGINVNQTHTTGFAAVVSTFGTYNAGVASVYIGGVAHRKQDGTVGDLNYARLGGVGIGGSSDGANMQFSVVNDKLQLKTLQYQVGACVTLILSKRN